MVYWISANQKTRSCLMNITFQKLKRKEDLSITDQMISLSALGVHKVYSSDYLFATTTGHCTPRSISECARYKCAGQIPVKVYMLFLGTLNSCVYVMVADSVTTAANWYPSGERNFYVWCKWTEIQKSLSVKHHFDKLFTAPWLHLLTSCLPFKIKK